MSVYECEYEICFSGDEYEKCGKIISKESRVCDRHEILVLNQRITHLKSAIKDMAQGLRFYANSSNWTTDGVEESCVDVIDKSDTDYLVKGESYGGKRARETLLKHKQILDHLNREKK